MDASPPVGLLAPSEGGLGQERITKALAGTLRADRLKGIAADQLDVAPPLDGMSSRAAAEWTWVAPLVESLGLLTASDLRARATYRNARDRGAIARNAEPRRIDDCDRVRRKQGASGASRVKRRMRTSGLSARCVWSEPARSASYRHAAVAR